MDYIRRDALASQLFPDWAMNASSGALLIGIAAMVYLRHRLLKLVEAWWWLTHVVLLFVGLFIVWHRVRALVRNVVRGQASAVAVIVLCTAVLLLAGFRWTSAHIFLVDFCCWFAWWHGKDCSECTYEVAAAALQSADYLSRYRQEVEMISGGFRYALLVAAVAAVSVFRREGGKIVLRPDSEGAGAATTDSSNQQPSDFAAARSAFHAGSPTFFEALRRCQDHADIIRPVVVAAAAEAGAVGAAVAAAAAAVRIMAAHEEEDEQEPASWRAAVHRQVLAIVTLLTQQPPAALRQAARCKPSQWRAFVAGATTAVEAQGNEQQGPAAGGAGVAAGGGGQRQRRLSLAR